MSMVLRLKNSGIDVMKWNLRVGWRMDGGWVLRLQLSNEPGHTVEVSVGK